MSQSIEFVPIPTAEITPASVEIEEEESVLATIGHLPEPYVHSAKKVLAITELLEHILLDVGETNLDTLLLSQRVNKHFFNTIKDSVKLQRLLFFQMNPTKKRKTSAITSDLHEKPPKPRLNPFVHYPNDPDVIITQGHRCSNMECNLTHPGNTDPELHHEHWWFILMQAGWISPLNIKVDDPNASWRKMWTTDPPVEIHSIKCKALHGAHMKLLKMGPLMDKVKEIGLAQRKRRGSQLEYYFEMAAPRRMNLPASKCSTKQRDREIAGQRRWAYTKLLFYVVYWMLILMPVGCDRGVYVGIAAFYLSIKILFAVLWIKKHRKATRKAAVEARLLKIKQEADEAAAKIAKKRRDEQYFQQLIAIVAKKHDITPKTVATMRRVFYQWLEEGRLKTPKKLYL